MKEYIVLFDFASAFPASLILIDLIFLFSFTYVIIYLLKKKPNKEKEVSIFNWFKKYNCNILFPLISFVFIYMNYTYYNLWIIHKNKKYEFVEGNVYDFEPMYISNNRFERFKVHNITFKYSDGAITYGFNNTKFHGGPIDEGKQVRIIYIRNDDGNIILKLEIKK